MGKKISSKRPPGRLSMIGGPTNKLRGETLKLQERIGGIESRKPSVRVRPAAIRAVRGSKAALVTRRKRRTEMMFAPLAAVKSYAQRQSRPCWQRGKRR